MGAMASQITSLTIVNSTVYWGADQRKHQNSASLAFVREIHRWPVNSPRKWPVTQTMFPFDDVIMWNNYDVLSTGVLGTNIIRFWVNIQDVLFRKCVNENIWVSQGASNDEFYKAVAQLSLVQRNISLPFDKAFILRSSTIAGQ